MKTLVTLALSTALSVIATTGSSQTVHDMIIEKRGYFPQYIHIQPGDSIRFINKSGNWARLYTDNDNDNNWGYDANDPCNTDSNGDYYFDGPKDGWNTGWISNNGNVVIQINSCTETNLKSPYVYRYGGNNSYYRGYISFDQVNVGG